MISAAQHSSGGSLFDWASLLIAGAAFLVSAASLWITSLRRPSVEIDAAPAESNRLESGGSSGEPSLPLANLHVYLFIANTGSSGTILESLDIRAFRESNAGAPLFAAFTGGPIAGMRAPKPLERAGTETDSVALRLEPDPAAAADGLEFARRLHGLRSVSITVRWSFRRPQALRPWKRESVLRTLDLTFEAGKFRQEAIAHWSRWDEYKPLVEAAKGRGA